MMRTIRVLFAVAFIIIGATEAMAIEEAEYKVVEKEGRFEFIILHTFDETVGL